MRLFDSKQYGDSLEAYLLYWLFIDYQYNSKTIVIQKRLDELSVQVKFGLKTGKHNET